MNRRQLLLGSAAVIGAGAMSSLPKAVPVAPTMVDMPRGLYIFTPPVGGEVKDVEFVMNGAVRRAAVNAVVKAGEYIGFYLNEDGEASTGKYTKESDTFTRVLE